MTKELFERAEMEVIEFKTDDVIITSEYEGEKANNESYIHPSLF
jgi:hypothetical protein